MYITLVKYTDVYRNEFLVEAYTEDTDTNDILDEIIDKNELFNRKVISREPHRISFNDGTQAILLTIPLNSLEKVYTHNENIRELI